MPSGWSRLHALGVLALALTATRVAWVASMYFDGAARRHHLEAAWFLFAGVALIYAVACRRGGAAASDPSTPSGRRTDGAFLAASLTVSALLYAAAVPIGFLSDDYVLLEQRIWDASWTFVRPLPHAVLKGLGGQVGAAALHLLNIVLHGLNGWLVYRLASRLGGGRAQAIMGGALFLTFPASVEAVAWISGIFDLVLVSSTLFYALALLDHRRAAVPRGALATVAALLSKETAVVLPVLGTLLWTLRPINRRAWGVSLVVTATYVMGRLPLFWEAAAADAPLGYFVKELLVRPFASLAAPWTTAELQAAPVLLGALPVVALALALVVYLRRPAHTLRPLVYALWSLAGAAVVYEYLYIGPLLEGSRYLYLPAVGWSLLLAELAAGGGAGSRARLAGTAAVLVACLAGAAGIRQHLGPWREAARTRDRVLGEAVRTAAGGECRSYEFAGVPDSTSGAYVFRNGWPQALDLAGVPTGGAAACRYTWTGHEFVRSDSAAGQEPGQVSR